MGEMSFSKFTVPAGADPMGIGVPDYGESNFDPVEFIRRSWEDTQAKNLFGDKQKKDAYDAFAKKIPTTDEWDAKTGKALNDKSLEVGQRFANDVAGGFDPAGTGSADMKKRMQYDKEMANLKGEMSLYQAMKPKANFLFEQARSATQFENIDQDLTARNLKAFDEEPDLRKKNELLQNPDMIVYKPKPVEVVDELSKAFNAFIPELDKEITSEDFDTKSGMFRTTTMEKMDPVKLDKAMDQVWASLSERVQNEFKRRYENAPKSQKTAKVDGAEIPMDEKVWFKAQYSPKYAEKMGVAYRGKTSDADMNFNWGIPGKDENGNFIKEAIAETKQIAISPDGKKEGPVAKVNAEGVIPMQGAFKTAFQMPNTISSFDAATGVPTKPGTSAWHIPDNLSFLPVASEDIKDKTTQAILVKKGDFVPAEVQKQLIAEERPEVYTYEPYLTSISSEKQISAEIPGIIKGSGAEELWPIDQYSMNHTTITPWREIEKYVKGKAAGLKLNVKELDNFIAEFQKELNSGRHKIDVSNKDALYESIYGTTVKK